MNECQDVEVDQTDEVIQLSSGSECGEEKDALAEQRKSCAASAWNETKELVLLSSDSEPGEEDTVSERLNDLATTSKYTNEDISEIVRELVEEVEILKDSQNFKVSIDAKEHTKDGSMPEPVDCSMSEPDDCNSNTETTAVAYKFEQIPLQVTGAWKEFEDPHENYTRGCKWSPDGSCILVCCNDNTLRLFNFPGELCTGDVCWEDMKEMSSVLRIQEGGPIYDFSWYPLMTSCDPVTCCLASTSLQSSVHLWDAFTGELRCSYRPYNHLDEIATPHSIAFDFTGQKLYCGFNKMVRVFDVAVPGRDCVSRPTYLKKVGQSGIISCFAFSPEYSNISAVGSYNKTVGIYSEPSGCLEHLLVGQSGGVTHLKFSPDGTKLYSGGRKDLEILCWDLRNLGSVLCSFRRLCLTNQRLYFDVSKCGQYLVSGNDNGVIAIWNIARTPTDVPNSSYPIVEPLQFYQGHEDCVNGISLHPTVPMLASCSGQRKFPDPVDSEDEQHETGLFTHKSVKKDFSLRLWWASDF